MRAGRGNEPGPDRRPRGGGGPMVRVLPTPPALGWTLIALSTPFAGAEDQGKPPSGVPDPLASFFRPPPGFAADFGAYKSPLVFDDGRPVRDAGGWQERRREILESWHAQMGPWPALI